MRADSCIRRRLDAHRQAYTRRRRARRDRRTLSTSSGSTRLTLSRLPRSMTSTAAGTRLRGQSSAPGSRRCTGRSRSVRSTRRRHDLHRDRRRPRVFSRSVGSSDADRHRLVDRRRCAPATDTGSVSASVDAARPRSPARRLRPSRGSAVIVPDDETRRRVAFDGGHDRHRSRRRRSRTPARRSAA